MPFSSLKKIGLILKALSLYYFEFTEELFLFLEPDDLDLEEV